jgi:hypothetical protein
MGGLKREIMIDGNPMEGYSCKAEEKSLYIISIAVASDLRS